MRRPPPRLRETRNKCRVASERAAALLTSFLDAEQRTEFAATGSFHVRLGSNLYRINRGRIANIDVLQADDAGLHVRHRLCVHPQDPELPIEDVMLSQLLWLRNDESRVLATANIHPAPMRLIPVSPDEGN